MDELKITFEGPFSWSGFEEAPCILDVPEGQEAGVYLWTVPQDDHELICYVGQTGRAFGKRMVEHYKEHASGFYHLNSVPEFQRGVRVALWPGLWDSNNRATVPDCIRFAIQNAPLVQRLAMTYRFYLGPVDGSRRLRERIEGAIATALYSSPPPIGTFQELGIRYRPRKPTEEPLSCDISAPKSLLGLPTHLQV